jgi:hypothetical protein
VFLNVTGGGSKKLNIAVPELTLVSGADTTGAAKAIASIVGADLTFSGLFQVATATGAIPRNNPDALRKLWSDFAAAGAHAGLHGLLTVRGDRLEVEARLYDLTTPDQRPIATEVEPSAMCGGATRSPTTSCCSSRVARHCRYIKLAFTRGDGRQGDLRADYDGPRRRPSPPTVRSTSARPGVPMPAPWPSRRSPAAIRISTGSSRSSGARSRSSRVSPASTPPGPSAPTARRWP